jgi:hypothetical protein
VEPSTTAKGSPVEDLCGARLTAVKGSSSSQTVTECRRLLDLLTNGNGCSIRH